MDKAQITEWYHLDRDKVCQHLQVDPQLGLTEQQLNQRSIDYGPNEIVTKQMRPVWRMMLDQFRDFMILVLLAAAIISGIIGEAVDTLAILIIVILNAIIGVVQEYRAERAVAALKAMAPPTSTVLRHGVINNIPSSELLPGDIVMLEAGNIIAADCRLLEAEDLEINEAALTGESAAVLKFTDALPDTDLGLGEQRNLAFKGTQVNRGRGVGIVIATGMASQLGKIANLLTTAKEVKTPLQKRLTAFGRRLAMAVLAICAIIFIVGLLRGEPWLLMLLTAISLAVAAIPEALPAVVSASLALGARKMSHQQALIRNLPAVETLGSVTFICTDKTGTLTQNKMQLDQLYADEHLQGDIPSDDHGLWHYLKSALALSNDVKITQQDIIGDPTEIALYQAAATAGYLKQDIEQQLPRIGEVAFSAERQCMTTLHQSDNTVIAFTKGAPEQVIKQCQDVLRLQGVLPLDQQQMLAQAQKLAGEGYRVLAVAMRRFDELPGEENSIEQQLTLLALVALIDPPRAEAADAVQQCLQAGITPLMITGDHPATALAIATRLALSTATERVITGSELAQMSDEQLQQQIKTSRVYARVSPQQKIRIVQALQRNGEFCAMTGDGVNDAPALKQAEIGIAMGQKGTEVAREAADMVLLDDNFATIVAAVREGRRIFDNIRKFIKYTMTSNAGEIWTLLLAPFLGLPIPLLPIHILWINLVTDGLPGLALAAEPGARNIMQRPPRPPQENIFAHGMWQHILWVGLLIGGVSLMAQAWALHYSAQHWQTMVFTVLTFSQLVHVLVIRSESESIFTLGLLSNKPLMAAVVVTVILQLLVIYVPMLNEIFKTTPLGAVELLLCFTLPLIVGLAVELEKYLRRRTLVNKLYE